MTTLAMLVSLARSTARTMLLSGLIATGIASADAEPLYGTDLVAPPASSRHQFRVYLGDYFARGTSLGEAEVTLAFDGNTYRIDVIERGNAIVSLLMGGAIVERSSGTIGPNGFAPSRFSEQRGSKPPRVVLLDESSGKVTLAEDNRTGTWEPGIQDRVSVTYQLGLMARTTPARFVAGALLTLPVATLGEVAHMRFSVIGPETLDLPEGKIATLHLVRLADDPKNDNRIEVWLAPDQQMLPVRMRIIDPDGHSLDQIRQKTP